jgi:hypothetical protein
MSEAVGYCDDLARALGFTVTDGYLPAECCDSCHDGSAWEPFEVEHDGRRYEVCCWMLDRARDASGDTTGGDE